LCRRRRKTREYRVAVVKVRDELEYEDKFHQGNVSLVDAEVANHIRWWNRAILVKSCSFICLFSSSLLLQSDQISSILCAFNFRGIDALQ